jgi:hypothetical protein
MLSGEGTGVVDLRVSQITEEASDLAVRLEDAREENRTLKTMSVVSLGFGLGVGGVLGIIFMLVVCKLGQRSAEA